MTELNISPYEFFQQNSSKLIDVRINGLNTKVLKLSDNHGKYLAIPAIDKRLSNICGQIILDYWIKEIDYAYYKGGIALIKAYY